MTVAAQARRPPAAARRLGYVVAAAINVAMLYVVNVWPGWQMLSFLTDDTRRVLGWVNLMLLANLVVNLVYLVDDRRWLKALGDLMTAVVGLASAIGFLRVFPFDFGASTFDATLLVRVVLIVAVIGTALALVVQFVVLIVRLLELSIRNRATTRTR